MASKRCPECGHAAGKTALFCQKCGAKLDGGAKAEQKTEGGAEAEVFSDATVDGLLADFGVEDGPFAPGLSEPSGGELPDKPSAPSEPSETGPTDGASGPVPEPRPAVLFVSVLNGSHAGEEKPLPPDGACTMGAGEDADVCLAGDPSLSRRHARIAVRGGQVFIEDLGSTNSTFIRVQAPRAVFPGDVLLLGQTVVRLVERDKSDGG